MFDQKILCIGNNSEDTDTKTSELATSNATVNHGLISNTSLEYVKAGYYHTSLLDVSAGGIVELAKKFDLIMLLDQPESQWSHWKVLLSSYRIMLELEKKGHITQFRNNTNIQKLIKFDEIINNSKSFCIYPWIEKIESNGKLLPCARSSYQVTTVDKFTDWRTDPGYVTLRRRMLQGERLPDVCQMCYTYEDQGIESYRTYETKEWISKLGINSLDDLENIEHPHCYEVRLNNTCNIACRGCKPEHSSRIETEYKTHNIQFFSKQSWEYSSVDIIDLDTLGPDVRVYLTGGEPTVIPDVYTFMEKCIKLGKTDFDFTLGTNGAHLSKKFLALSEKFSNMNFSFSLDGFGKINDYWRWGSDWDTVIKNAKILESQGHTISINCVPGIYNATNLHLLLEFLDQEFPFSSLYLQLNYFKPNSIFNHPNHGLVLESMERCKNTNIYYADGKSAKTTIDRIFDHYSQNPTCNLDDLKQFFDFNDRLDQVRGVRLGDYIPELEACRKFIQKT